MEYYFLGVVMPNFFCLHFIMLISFVSHAQQIADTSSFKKLHPVALYYTTLGQQSPLYNGKEYLDYGSTIRIGHQFFSSKEFAMGSIHFDGMVFEDAMILYDIIKDKLVLRHHNKYFKIDLPIEKISEFKLWNHHFIHLLPDSAQVIEEGFYDKLYQGNMSLLAKRKKEIREELSRNDLITLVDEKNSFYIEKQGVYYPVTNMRQLLRVLNDRKDVIRKYLNKMGMTFKKDREAAILMAVKYYDSLSN